MINFVEGDFFDYDADIRINTVNCVGVMGTGVALQFKNKYPAMFDEYLHECKQGRVKIGKPHVWIDNSIFSPKNLTIINFPTKDHWKNPSEYEYVEKGLVWLRKYLLTKGKITITVPALGCGHGGLDWHRVKKMISEKLKNIEANILVFSPSSSINKVTHTSLKTLQENHIIKLSPNDFHYPKNLRGKSAHEIYTKGNPEIFNNKVLTITVDKNPNEREKEAIIKCLDLLPNKGVAYCLGFNNSFEIDLVKELLKKNVNLLLVVPYGILSLKIRKDLKPLWDENKIALVSISQPLQTWKASESIKALKFRFKISDITLIANFEYENLIKFEQEMQDTKQNIFYINYWKQKIDFYTRINAKKIGRNKKTYKPNIKPILESLFLE